MAGSVETPTHEKELCYYYLSDITGTTVVWVWLYHHHERNQDDDGNVTDSYWSELGPFMSQQYKDTHIEELASQSIRERELPLRFHDGFEEKFRSQTN